MGEQPWWYRRRRLPFVGRAATDYQPGTSDHLGGMAMLKRSHPPACGVDTSP